MSVKGVTDVNGIFTGQGRCGSASMGSTITKDGYYLGSAPIPRFSKHNEILNRWEPWNDTCVAILRPIGKPVGLCAKKVQTEVPVLGQPCGYDLEVGDWVTPYGKGMNRDFIFNIQSKDVKNAQNYDEQGELTFANASDGLQETSFSDNGKNSVFRWEREARGDGYKPQFKLQNTWWNNLGQKPIRSFKFDDTEWDGYFFRVRTVEQDGKIVSAHYGKIRGGIEIEPRGTKTCTVVFTYYFNPTSLDRNLEWDKNHNLLSNLSDLETPREP